MTPTMTTVTDIGKSQSDAPDLYANQIRITFGFYDFCFDFLLIFQGAQLEEDKPQVRVRVSPQKALALYVLLGHFLAEYRNHFGPLELPEEVIARLSGKENKMEPSEKEQCP